ncbi:histidine kinase [Rothia sp. ZJ1223]|uniref:sensor histidine kinase n=1 Tax=Rothia sp. ZJ1223 TaxID=2811098 RepID=UPI00195AB504|nr:hypothetical protein [Rothia sp. ZJ1223]
MQSISLTFKQLAFMPAPRSIRVVALCGAFALCFLEIAFHIDYLLTPYGMQALVLVSHFAVWGLLFYRGSRLSILVYWSALLFGSLVFATYSDYYFLFSLAVFPAAVAFSSARSNLVNFCIFCVALVDDVQGASIFNAVAFVLVSLSVFFFFPLALRIHWERRLHETKEREVFQSLTEESNKELARELHDGLARHISSLTLQANKAFATQDIDGKNELLIMMSKQSRDALDDLRRIMRVLRKEQDLVPRSNLTGTSMNLNHFLNQRVEDLREEGFTMQVQINDLDSVPTSLIPTVQRIINELFFNIKKHADQLETITFSAIVEGKILSISTSNRTRSVLGVPGTQYGLAGIAERIEVLGGTIDAIRNHSMWRVQISLPL